MRRPLTIFIMCILASLLAGSTIAQQGPDNLSQKTKALSELVRTFGAQAAAAHAQILTGATTTTAGTISGTFFPEMRVEMPAVNEIVKNELGQILARRDTELTNFADQLARVSTNISNVNGFDAEKTLKSILAPSIVVDIFSTTPLGERLPNPPHVDPGAVYSVNDFISGPGVNATIDYPSVGELGYHYMGYGYSTLCTATLISSNYALTAAHCFCDLANARDAKTCQQATYKRGMITVSPLDKAFLALYFQNTGEAIIDQIILDPQYKNPASDLALIHLLKPVNGIEPAPINASKAPIKAGLALIIGFGQHSPLSSGGVSSGQLAPVRNSQGIKLWSWVDIGNCAGLDRNKKSYLLAIHQDRGQY